MEKIINQANQKYLMCTVNSFQIRKLPSPIVDAVWKYFDHSDMQNNINLYHHRFELIETIEISNYKINK